MGIYVFNKDILIKGLTEDAVNLSSRHDFGYSVLPELVKGARVFAYQFAGYWQDIGTIGAYYEANMELLSETPSFSLNGTFPVLTAVHKGERIAPTSHIARNTVINNSLISHGCVIKGNVMNSILCPGVFVDERVEVRDSIVMEGCSIGYHSIVDRCILDEGANIGKMCYIGFGSSFIPGKYDVTILGKNAIVPSHTAIGRNCRVMPSAGPRDFPTTAISHDSIVSSEVTKRMMAGR